MRFYSTTCTWKKSVEWAKVSSSVILVERPCDAMLSSDSNQLPSAGFNGEGKIRLLVAETESEEEGARTILGDTMGFKEATGKIISSIVISEKVGFIDLLELKTHAELTWDEVAGIEAGFHEIS
jgi:hypothetical protein